MRTGLKEGVLQEIQRELGPLRVAFCVCKEDRDRGGIDNGEQRDARNYADCQAWRRKGPCE
jgi:hypothetical protein